VAVAPVQAFLQTSSVEAVVNAPLITLRAPIDGQIIEQNVPSLGSSMSAGQTIYRIANARADHGKVDALQRQIDELNSFAPTLAIRIAATRAEIAALSTQAEAFRTGRIAKLTAEAGIIDNDIVIAESKLDEARAAETRAGALVKSGATSVATFDQSRRDAAVAEATLKAAKFHRQELAVELASAQTGTFLGDGYNDRPSSAQRLDDSRQRLVDLEAELAAKNMQLTLLQSELSTELARYNDLAQAEVAIPASGRVWEVLASPGEEVGRGRDLMRLVDCSGALVTASVAESVYNRLHAGMAASFTPRGETRGLKGTIVNLTGLAGAPSNFAIEPSALAREPYRVTVAVPGLANGGNCTVGRTGRVVFEQNDSSSWFSQLTSLGLSVIG
jgi:multidrug resistance efflux pump